MKSEEDNPLTLLSGRLADVVEGVGPAVVRVNGRRRRTASGLVYAPDTILTASHTLEREEDLAVETHDGRKLQARFAGRDPATDLAVVRTEGLGLEAAKFSEEVRVGQLALAVGRSSSSGPRVSLGVVSSVGGPLRTGRGAVLERYVQTDAAPYPGFSGGALVSAGGSVLGMLTAGLSRDMALAVPPETIRRVADALSEEGYIRRGFLGILSQPVHLPESQRADQPYGSGLLVVGVEDGSPAGRGGLLLGDILVSLDGRAVEGTEDLQSLLPGEKVGETVSVGVIRGEALRELEVTVGERRRKSRREP